MAQAKQEVVAAKQEVIVVPLSRRPPCWRASYVDGELLFDIRLHIMGEHNKLRYDIFDIYNEKMLDQGWCYFDLSDPPAMQDILVSLVRARVSAASVIVRNR